jgi:hypothetical protein
MEMDEPWDDEKKPKVGIVRETILTFWRVVLLCALIACSGLIAKVLVKIFLIGWNLL